MVKSDIPERIKAIEFKMLSPDMIRKMSVVKVTTPELYDIDGYPVENGLMDLRMGVVDPSLRCRTCRGTIKTCPGHFGHIELARPVIHIKYVPYINLFLRFTCRKCGRILLTDEQIDNWREKIDKAAEKGELYKWKKISELIEKAKLPSKCPRCGEKVKKVKFDKAMLTFYYGNEQLTPIDVREWLERISSDDAELLGLDKKAGRPEWMVLTVLPVPPITMRPSITLENVLRSEDDLTHKLGEIVRTNERLRENLNAGVPEVIIEDLWRLLQWHVTTYFTNTTSGIPIATHRSGRPLKTLEQRLRGKEGRFRRNLAGKRVNFSARAVISPDPFIDIDEVGVPYEVAKTLTVPERVTEHNIKWIKKLIKNAPNYPCVKQVITPSGLKKVVNERTKDMILEEVTVGYIAERQMMDGDIVLFNRQPSLHRISIMAHRARVLPGRTFRINLATTVPYNADFDGDEMNLHLPQTEEAMIEAQLLMEVNKNLVTPRYGRPIIGGKEDIVSGIYLLTKDDSKFDKYETSLMLSKIGIYKLPKPDRNGMYKGKDIFSLLLPEDFNYEGKMITPVNGEDKVVIKNGKLIKGVIDANSIGAERGYLLKEFLAKYGLNKTAEFLNRLTKLSIMALQFFGLSVGVSDADLEKKVFKEIKEVLNKAKEEANELIKKYKRGTLQPFPGKSLEESLEFKIVRVLNKARNLISRIIEKSFDKETATLAMIRSKARGSNLNLGMIAGSLGQQALRGLRITIGFKNRTLPHFEKGDLGIEARGFVRHGYKGGLTHIEFFFHAIPARDQIMDTSLRTPKSGYLQRRLVSSLQELKVVYDGTVRDLSNNIIQFSYGEDGIDVCKSYLKGEAAKIDPGEVVGVIASQSIGEPGTQMALRTKWGALEANITLGLPRIIEVFDARRKPSTPSMTIYLKEKYRSERKIKEFMKKILELNVKDIAKEINIDITQNKLEIVLDEEKVADYNIDVDYVKELIKKATKQKVNRSKNVIYVKVEKPKKVKRGNKKEEKSELEIIYDIKKMLSKIIVNGVKGIRQVILSEELGEKVIKTLGSNLREILKMEEVDASRTTTNDIFEIYRVLGIEAARNAIVNEIVNVYKEQGIEINKKHIMLVADAMTVDGAINGITRYGISKSFESVLARATFEIPLRHLFDASVHHEIDRLTSIMANIMVNQPIPAGTGMPKLVVKSDEE